METNEIEGAGIMSMIAYLVEMSPKGSVLEPSTILASGAYQFVHEYSQFMQEGPNSLTSAPQLEFDVLRFTHEILKIVPEAFQSQRALTASSTSFQFLETRYEFTNVWRQDGYEISVSRL